MIRVAFQGEHGAYSEDAAIKFFGEEIETIPCISFSEVFQKVGENVFGIIPIENSLEGSVGQAIDLFLENDVKICGEEIMRISHCLIADVGDIKSIETVYSHPQALAQCRKFIEKMGFKTVPVYDTAGSVKIIKDNKIGNSAAIAGEKAAKIYGMKILARDIQDDANNFTRFFVLSKKEEEPTGYDKTFVICSIKNVPGALLGALEAFARQKINLAKIESRPIKGNGKIWEYVFCIDLEGHQKEPRVKNALKEMEKHAVFVKNVGSYPRQKNVG